MSGGIKNFFEALKKNALKRKRKNENNIKAIQFKLRNFLNRFKSVLQKAKTDPIKQLFMEHWRTKYKLKIKEDNLKIQKMRNQKLHR